jgi:uncharacterized protein YndB with AHSA1/START domain
VTVETATEPIVHERQIEASPERVFAFFTDPQKLTRWLADEATLDPRPGGVNLQKHLGREGKIYRMRGDFVEVSPPTRLVFTWGYDEGVSDMPAGSSTVEVTFEPREGGTFLTLVHRDLPASEHAAHDSGWDQMLGRLAAALAEA